MTSADRSPNDLFLQTVCQENFNFIYWIAVIKTVKSNKGWKPYLKINKLSNHDGLHVWCCSYEIVRCSGGDTVVVSVIFQNYSSGQQLIH